MEKGTIYEMTFRDGRLSGNVKLAKGRKLPIGSDFDLKPEWKNKECTVEYQGNQIIRLVVEGQEVPKVSVASAAPSNSQSQSRPSGQGRIRPEAPGQRGGAQGSDRTIPEQQCGHAPYNFIPLSQTVVPAEFTAKEDGCFPAFTAYHGQDAKGIARYSGYIECEIETLTPMYLKDTSRIEEESKTNTDFFSPGGSLKIPGSSLRGLVRSLVEIVSWSKFMPNQHFEERTLYFRKVGDSGRLGNDYRALMVDASDNFYPRVKAGILRKKGTRYEIIPAKIDSGTQTGIYRVNYTASGALKENPDITTQPFTFKTVYFKPAPPANHTHYRRGRDGQLIFKYALVTEVSEQPQPGYTEGFLVASGNIPRKHMHWIVAKGESKPFDVPDEVIQAYSRDKNRIKNADLLAMVKEYNEAPCFYIVGKQEEIIAIGHTGMFRIPYQLSIGAHVPDVLKNDKIVPYDLSEAIFGKLSHFAGRVYFEDCKFIKGTKASDQEVVPKILSEPKPTAVQYYLWDRKAPGNFGHYNDQEAEVRGYKQYWHHRREQMSNPAYWQYNSNQFNSKVMIKIKPIGAGAFFQGRIRFENLSAVELGALLFVLDLPENCCHKLGMGKPLGLGTVAIRPRLVICDRQKRYSRLFDGQGWYTGEKEENRDTFKQAFEQYVLNHLPAAEKSSAAGLWDVPRLNALRIMLSLEHTSSSAWDEQVKYMGYGDRNPSVLPQPENVVARIGRPPSPLK